MIVGFKNEETKERFVDDVLSELRVEYFLEDGTKVHGKSISALLDDLRRWGGKWKNLGSRADFESLLEEAGFKIVRGRSMRHYHGGKMGLGVEARVVTV